MRESIIPVNLSFQLQRQSSIVPKQYFGQLSSSSRPQLCYAIHPLPPSPTQLPYGSPSNVIACLGQLCETGASVGEATAVQRTAGLGEDNNYIRAQLVGLQKLGFANRRDAYHAVPFPAPVIGAKYPHSKFEICRCPSPAPHTNCLLYANSELGRRLHSIFGPSC